MIPCDPWHEGPKPDRLAVRGREVRTGDRVRLRPLGRADIMDLALDGKIATVAEIEQNYEGQLFLAVTVDDDPGRDFGANVRLMVFHARRLDLWPCTGGPT